MIAPAKRKPLLLYCIVYFALFVAVLVPVWVAAGSPLLQWRQPVYIVAGFAGVAGFCLLLVQPLLAAGLLPGMSRLLARRIHLWCGAALFVSVIIHVTGLWITSPPDVIDALLLRSPTAFSVWGVIALWAIVFAALIAFFRVNIVRITGKARGLRLWRAGHVMLAVLTVSGTVVHALLIQGTMGMLSKWVLSLLVCVVTIISLLSWRRSLR